VCAFQQFAPKFRVEPDRLDARGGCPQRGSAPLAAPADEGVDVAPGIGLGGELADGLVGDLSTALRVTVDDVLAGDAVFATGKDD
jgi:hypothetical protein